MTHIEIDLLVHAYVMGHMQTRFELLTYGYDEEGWFLAGDSYFTNLARSLYSDEVRYLLWDKDDKRVPDYSTDGHAALNLVERVSQIFGFNLTTRGFFWHAKFGNQRQVSAPTASLAIVLAALSLIGINIDPGEVVG